MNNLLDTHTFIWFVEGDVQLSKNAKDSIEKNALTNFISIASLWEISIKKISLGKLELKTGFSNISELIVNNGFQVLPITIEDTLMLSKLPFYHRDPFDRMLISQSLTRKLSLISKDKIFNNYGISLIW